MTDDNALTMANYGPKPEPHDPEYLKQSTLNNKRPLSPAREELRMIQAIAGGELGGDDEDADEAELPGDIYWFVSALLGQRYADTPERTRRIDAWLEKLGDAYTLPRASS